MFHFFTFKVCKQQQKKKEYIALLERTKILAKFKKSQIQALMPHKS